MCRIIKLSDIYSAMADDYRNDSADNWQRVDTRPIVSSDGEIPDSELSALLEFASAESAA